jgi:antitoxin CptB
MSGTTRSSEGLDTRRRQILFRAWHRGMREMDLIMGPFADAAIDRLTDAEVGAFERLIQVPDQMVLAWVMDNGPVPAEHDTPLLQQMRDFMRTKRL